MKRSAIPLVSILCLAIWACAQAVPAPPPVVTSGLSSVSCGLDDDLLSHVKYVQLLPAPNTDLVIPPDPTALDPDIQRDLVAAFMANPAFSKNELCKLDGIFINRLQCSSYAPSSCSTMLDSDVAANSWGLRTPSNKKYVAISLGLWRGNQCPKGSGQAICAPSFTQFHQRLAKALLDKTAGMPVNISPPTFQASTNTSGLSVLAALAHERGHIYWWETFVQPPGSTPLATTLMSEANAFCGGTIYPGGRWHGMPVGLPRHRYVQFADLSSNSPVNVANLPTLLQQSGNPIYANIAIGIIDGIYNGGQYPSLLAIYSPDEDFVEAFEWSVLRNAGLRDASVNITGAGRSILQGGVADMRGTERKLACFDALSR